MKEKIATFCTFGFIAAVLDLTRQIELLFSIEVAVVRGIVALWMMELVARIGRSVADTLRHSQGLSELYDRLTSTLASGISLYLMWAVWIGSAAILDGMFETRPYSTLGAFLKLGSSFTVALWLILNVLTFLTGSREKAHDFINTIGRVWNHLSEGDARNASKPIKEYHHR